MKKGRLILLTLLLAMLFALQPFSVLAAVEKSQQPEDVRAVLINSADARIDHGTVTTTVFAAVEGISSVTSVKIQLELQKLSGGSYSTVKTWSETFSGRSGALEKSRVINPFSTYRLKATVTAYASGTSESRTLYEN